MRYVIAVLVLVAALACVTAAHARGGRTDDCTPDSTDPDCVDAKPK
jgi:hypothetical protein